MQNEAFQFHLKTTAWKGLKLCFSPLVHVYDWLMGRKALDNEGAISGGRALVPDVGVYVPQKNLVVERKCFEDEKNIRNRQLYKESSTYREVCNPLRSKERHESP